MHERSAWSECPYGFIKYQVPMQRMGPFSYLIILNSSHGVLVGMVIKLSGPVTHTNHVCGPELY